MKLLMVTKRHFMTKDIIEEEYGRQYELAAGLAGAGWVIKGHCLDYRSTWGVKTTNRGGIDWRSYSALSFLAKWYRDLKREIRSWQPDLILGCSDPLHIAAAFMAVRDHGATRFAVDLHDNLDCKGMMRFPGLDRGVERAIHAADLVTCVSQPLAEKVKSELDPCGPVVVLESAIPDIFVSSSTSKEAGRRVFGLDGGSNVIGIAGSLYRNRGIETVLAGFDLLRKEDCGLVLALAGPIDMSPARFEQEGVRYLGNLDWKTVPAFMSTFDVGIVPNIRPLFADYCYPQKAVELCALSVPFVAADFGVMQDMAEGNEEILYRADDPVDFARAVQYQLENRVALNVTVRNWAQQAHEYGKSLMRILGQAS